jgi:hypothetical protein
MLQGISIITSTKPFLCSLLHSSIFSVGATISALRANTGAISELKKFHHLSPQLFTMMPIPLTLHENHIRYNALIHFPQSSRLCRNVIFHYATTFESFVTVFNVIRSARFKKKQA